MINSKRCNLKPETCNLKPKKWACGPIAIIDAFGILTDEQIRRYFEIGCEVKALGRGHLARLKREVREK